MNTFHNNDINSKMKRLVLKKESVEKNIILFDA